MPEPHELAATLTQDIVDAIGKTLAAAMETAVRNGADSRSMPDEYVTLAAWLSGVKPAHDVLLKVAGKAFYCSCGCNVFKKHNAVSPFKYTCNACGTTYE